VLARAELIDIAVPELEGEELLSQSDIARIADVSRQAVHVWIGKPGFPRSVGRSGTGPRWRRSDVLSWLANGRKTVGRPSVREAWPPGTVRS
ncbi:MAG: hypothetical protein M3P43_17485, partial [Actinomycetota bacterium]|nr:hypothetical protein [Actinomycetota bacterium]